jgi:tRNA(Ile2) C34 agmatinyltransferase TiaS
MKNNMHWDSLQKNQCPKCSGKLEWGTERGIFCSKCGFKISEQKMKEITSNLTRNDLAKKPKDESF